MGNKPEAPWRRIYLTSIWTDQCNGTNLISFWLWFRLKVSPSNWINSFLWEKVLLNTTYHISISLWYHLSAARGLSKVLSLTCRTACASKKSPRWGKSVSISQSLIKRTTHWEREDHLFYLFSCFSFHVFHLIFCLVWAWTAQVQLNVERTWGQLSLFI